MDSNHDKSLQRALCYHYTTGQAKSKVAFGLGARKAKVRKRGGSCELTSPETTSRGLALRKSVRGVFWLADEFAASQEWTCDLAGRSFG